MYTASPCDAQTSWFGGGKSANAKAAPVAAPAPPPFEPVKIPQGKALLLIGFNDAKKTWEVNPDAVKALQRIPGPLCVAAVCGRARQGKSFLLNTMLGRMTGQDLPQGFKVSPTQVGALSRGRRAWL
jgi:hypothetical protein